MRLAAAALLSFASLSTLSACANTPQARAQLAAYNEAQQQRAAVQLAAAIGDRVPGKPQSCLRAIEAGSSHQIEGTAIVYESIGRNTVWVNRPSGGCPGLHRDRAIIATTPTGQFCRGDIFTVIDPPTPGTFGSCTFGDFVPYRRPGT